MRIVSKREACAILGISKRTLERRMAQGVYETSIVHGPHGPERRVHLPSPPADDGGTLTDAASPATTLAIREPVTHVTTPANPAPPEGVELATLALRALDEAMRENARLRAMLESRRPWWRRVGERLRRRP